MKKIERMVALVVFFFAALTIAKAQTFESGGLYFSVIAGAEVPGSYPAGIVGQCEVVSPADGSYYEGDITIPAFVTYKEDTYVVTRIGSKAFEEESTVENGNTAVATTDESHEHCLTSISIPETVTEIGDEAFENCTMLTSITLPSGLTYIGKEAFKNTEIEEIVIPEGVTEICDGAFYGCKYLTSVSLPSTLKIIDYQAFEHCIALESIVIPEGVTTLGASAFEECLALTSVTLPSTLETIGDEAFEWCYCLPQITIPDSVTVIGKSAFQYCMSLETVDISATSNLETIEASAFSNCVALEAITLPDSLKSIGANAFEYCSALESLNISVKSNLETIADYAFLYCPMLKVVQLPDSVKTIGEGVFKDCAGLMVISLGSGVESIGDYTFYGCENLMAVTSYNKTPPAITDDVFEEYHYKQAELDVYTESQKVYKAHAVWTKFMDITTGVATREAAVVDIRVNGYTISIVSDICTAKSIIYTLSGEMVYSGYDSEILLAAPGVYVVSVAAGADSVVKKIVIK